MTREQQRYLQQRLSVIRTNKPRRYFYGDATEKKPAAVIAAERSIDKAQKIVTVWREKDHAKKEAILKRIDEALDHCRRLILAGDWKAALKAVDQFEATKF